ncbi:uncharacterized protein LOC143038956 [Oratosquilla oratoria]|uniref:uncharacterized protein LOC143038956 n=1 Tax=Oratosquilla oratoria TaxID=337810 RepID=UPI003F757BAC
MSTRLCLPENVKDHRRRTSRDSVDNRKRQRTSRLRQDEALECPITHNNETPHGSPMTSKMGFKRFSVVNPSVIRGRGWCTLDTRYMAVTASVYSMCMAVLVVLVYGWRVSVNTAHARHLGDVYYGVQIAYVFILVAQLGLLGLSALLLVGVIKERLSLVAPWVVSIITVMSMEGVCCVYSNVLRDHVNKGFDAICRAEMAFYITRIVLNSVALGAVLRFFRKVRLGVSFKDPEAIEL